MHLESSSPASHQLATLFSLGPSRHPEKRARQQIDAALTEAGWHVQSRDAVHLNAGRGGLSASSAEARPPLRGLPALRRWTGIEAKKEGLLSPVRGASGEYAAERPRPLPRGPCGMSCGRPW